MSAGGVLQAFPFEHFLVNPSDVTLSNLMARWDRPTGESQGTGVTTQLVTISHAQKPVRGLQSPEHTV